MKSLTSYITEATFGWNAQKLLGVIKQDPIISSRLGKTQFYTNDGRGYVEFAINKWIHARWGKMCTHNSKVYYAVSDWHEYCELKDQSDQGVAQFVHKLADLNLSLNWHADSTKPDSPEEVNLKKELRSLVLDKEIKL